MGSIFKKLAKWLVQQGIAEAVKEYEKKTGEVHPPVLLVAPPPRSKLMGR